MSLKTLHQVIIFAGIAISLVFAGFCFMDPSTAGDRWFLVAGVGSIVAAIALVAYEIHFLKKTRRLVL
jgi:heme/copper-type cytochrome/quinol oxidase subunit 4